MYGYRHRPSLVSHVVSGHAVATLYYDHRDRLLAYESGNRTAYFVVADAVGTPQFVLDGGTGEAKQRYGMSFTQ